MRETGGRAVVRALEDEGVPFAFGIPGTHNIELYDALAESSSVVPVLVTDEQSASFMADAVWRCSGKLACANLVPGAGLTHALSGIAEAYLDHAAMLVLACGVRRDTGHAFQLHDVDQLAIAAPVTKAQLRLERGEEIYGAVREACRIARAGAPGPVLVEIPANLYLIPHRRPVGGPSSGRGAGPSGQELPGFGRGAARSQQGGRPEGPGTPRRGESPPPEPGRGEVERAAGLLRGAERPLLYLGAGAAGAGEALVRLAEALEAPVATTFQGKGVFPESHPLWLWPGFGDAAPPFVRRVAASCDATLAVGCRFGEVGTGSYGARPPAPLVHVDIDPGALNRNVPAEVAVTADGTAFVGALLELLEPRRPDPALRARIRRGHAAVRARWRREAQASEARGRVSPSRFLAALQERFGPGAIFTADSGNGTFLAVECLRLERPGHFLAPVDYSCMGYAVPAAVGAALARPDVPVIALAGDGAFLMTGLELLTAAARGLPLLVVVLRDRELAQIAQFQEMALGRKVASRLPDYGLAELCAGMGVECLALSETAAIGAALETAGAGLAEGRPVVVEVAIDYAVKSYFTRGVVKTNFLRLPWRERLRVAGRAALRRARGPGEPPSPG